MIRNQHHTLTASTPLLFIVTMLLFSSSSSRAISGSRRLSSRVVGVVRRGVPGVHPSGSGYQDDNNDAITMHRGRRGNRFFFGCYSARLPFSARSISCQQSPQSSSVQIIMQQLRGGASIGSSRNNSTTSASSTSSDDNAQPWRRAYLAVGSNMGNQYQNIAQALSALEAEGNVRVIRTSYLRMTAPMYVTDQPVFLNGAVEVETNLTPLELLRAIKRAESGLGRDIDPNSTTAIRYGPRPVDLDILLFEDRNDDKIADTQRGSTYDLIMQTEVLEIPHPRMAEREFVLSPMRDLEGNENRITHPITNKTMSELLDTLLTQNNNQTSCTSDDDQEEQAFRVLPLPRGRMLHFNKTLIMGILNVTPDSFSDGGKYSSSAELAASEALQMEKDGADIIDIGGESTRPGAEDVAIEEELQRVIPVIERIRQEENLDVPISIDTRSSIVARAAIEAGADIVNDVSGGTHDPEMLACVAELGVPMIIMHMRGNPKTMQSMTDYNDKEVSVVAKELMERSAAAERAGIPRWLQVVDPGIGFAKDVDGNLALLNGMDTLRKSCADLPFLIGPSRKGFIGKVSGEMDPKERDYGTIAACLAAIGIDDGSRKEEACNLLRVHNVKAIKQAVMVYEAIRNTRR